MTRQPVVISISREEVELCDPSNVVAIVSSWIPLLLERNRNRVQLEVRGYSDDPRELYDIPEVRRFCAALVDVFPGMFYWLDTESHMFALIMLLLYHPIRVEGGVTVATADLQEFFLRGHTELNAFCEYQRISPDASNQAIMKLYGGIIA